MKKLFFLVLIAISFSNIASAQNLGERYKWLQESYARIPLQKGLPFYDTNIKVTSEFPEQRIVDNAHYYFNSVIASPKVDTIEKRYSAKGKYVIYTNDAKDEEHKFDVEYKIDLVVKDGVYSVEMHDFNILYLTNKVEFEAKLKHAKMNDGHSNYFFALFNDQNKTEVRNFVSTLSKKTLPSQATAAN